jgi:hypothetical protein
LKVEEEEEEEEEEDVLRTCERCDLLSAVEILDQMKVFLLVPTTRF